MLVTGNLKGKTVVFDIPEEEIKKYPSFELITNEDELKTTDALAAAGEYDQVCKGVYSKTC